MSNWHFRCSIRYLGTVPTGKIELALTPSHLQFCDDNLDCAGEDSRNVVGKRPSSCAEYLNAERNPKFHLGGAVKMEQAGKSLGTGQIRSELRSIPAFEGASRSQGNG
jgi:hypothetical protein